MWHFDIDFLSDFLKWLSQFTHSPLEVYFFCLVNANWFVRQDLSSYVFYFVEKIFHFTLVHALFGILRKFFLTSQGYFNSSLILL